MAVFFVDAEVRFTVSMTLDDDAVGTMLEAANVAQRELVAFCGLDCGGLDAEVTGVRAEVTGIEEDED